MKYILPFFLLISCTDKKLDERRVRFSDIEINRYRISYITSIHEHVEVTKGDETEDILNAVDGDIDSIWLYKDTIVIKTVREPQIFENREKVFSYYIKIDSIPPPEIIDTIYGFPSN